ncbi:hypothetical protein LL912_15780 [Niabella sp. CC-SYL272]|uniref:hypothetical protein n=1 Tax=Niabella agricola TaxID=2891571 RepID=UPI001F2B3E6A|nr:hypothetical protein [Niabella agricola]MCF3110244.1 hypothetical protein [Niabella agricola]
MIEIILAFFLALWPSHPQTTTTGNGPIVIGVQVDGSDDPADTTGGDTEPIPPVPYPTQP